MWWGLRRDISRCRHSSMCANPTSPPALLVAMPHAVLRFSINAATGALTLDGEFSAYGSTDLLGGLSNAEPMPVVLSPDEKHIYVGCDKAIIVFTRDLGCVSCGPGQFQDEMGSSTGCKTCGSGKYATSSFQYT